MRGYEYPLYCLLDYGNHDIGYPLRLARGAWSMVKATTTKSNIRGTTHATPAQGRPSFLSPDSVLRGLKRSFFLWKFWKFCFKIEPNTRCHAFSSILTAPPPKKKLRLSRLFYKSLFWVAHVIYPCMFFFPDNARHVEAGPRDETIGKGGRAALGDPPERTGALIASIHDEEVFLMYDFTSMVRGLCRGGHASFNGVLPVAVLASGWL